MEFSLHVKSTMELYVITRQIHHSKITMLIIGNYNIGSGNDLLPARCQAITWINGGMSLYLQVIDNFAEMWFISFYHNRGFDIISEWKFTLQLYDCTMEWQSTNIRVQTQIRNTVCFIKQFPLFVSFNYSSRSRSGFCSYQLSHVGFPVSRTWCPSIDVTHST